MTPVSFCYWLQGFFELRGSKTAPLTEEQVTTISNHLNLVFAHSIDPETYTPEQQALAQAVHDGVIPAKPERPPFRPPTHNPILPGHGQHPQFHPDFPVKPGEQVLYKC